MEEQYKICLAGTNTPVEGTESLVTMEQITEWLAEHQVHYSEGDLDKPENDGSKYVFIPVEM